MPRETRLPVVGWREWIGLPGLGIDRMKAKIDTGARSSSLHAYDIRRFKRKGAPWVSFRVHPIQRDHGFRMLLGRQAVRGRFLVDSGHSFPLGKE